MSTIFCRWLLTKSSNASKSVITRGSYPAFVKLSTSMFDTVSALEMYMERVPCILMIAISLSRFAMDLYLQGIFYYVLCYDRLTCAKHASLPVSLPLFPVLWRCQLA